ncbi:Transcription factor spt8, partial [Gnomoniopsis sp. IMI 355080]
MDDFDQDHESSSDEQQDQDQDHDDTHTIEDADAMDGEEDDDFNQSDDDQDDEADQENDQDQDQDQDNDQDADQDNNDDDPTTRVDITGSSTNNANNDSSSNNNNKTSSTLNSPSTSSTTPRFFRPTVRPEALSARLYDIVPTMAAPQATSINALAITPDLRYWMTGGSDGYVRKYDGPGTINGKQLLTVAQRHPFVDSVVKAGILMSYWENFEPLHHHHNAGGGADGSGGGQSRARGGLGDDDKVLSPVYALAVHKDALWSLAGLESGGINIHSVRYDEGKVIHCLPPAAPSADGSNSQQIQNEGHTNAVSVLQLTPDEQNVLSGSWDKRILDWDLNTGSVANSFDGSGGQISAIELRPMSGAPIPPEAAEEPAWASETFTSNSNARTNGFFTNGSLEGSGRGSGAAADDAPVTGDDVGDGPAGGGGGGGGGAGSDHESLFGSPGGSLFGEGQMGGGGNAFGGDDDNEFSQAMLEPLEDAPADSSSLGGGGGGGGDTAMTDAPPLAPSSSAPDPAPLFKPEDEKDVGADVSTPPPLEQQ